MYKLLTLAALLGIAMDEPPIDAGIPQGYKISPRTRRDYNHLRMPAHGTVFKGMLYGFFDDDWARTNEDGMPFRSWHGVSGIPLEKTAKMNWKKCPLFYITFGGYNFRYHIGYGSLWSATSNGCLSRWTFDELQQLDADVRRNRIPVGDLEFSGITLLDLFEKCKYMAMASVAFDSVPISKSGCKTFLLMKKDMQFEAWDSIGLVLNEEIGKRKILPEVKNCESFDSAFTEDFYAFVRKNDYYFVTESGKLYHAPPPKKGEKSRTMKALWEDAKRPISAVIEDADHDKVWLFAKDKTAGAKGGLYFEMKNTIQTEAFDPAKLRPVDVEGRAKLLLEYLPLIRNAK